MAYYGGGGYSYSGAGGGGSGYYGYGAGEGASGSASSAYYNPEYYDRESGYGFEGTRTGAIDPGEDLFAKKRKIMNVSICVDFIRGFCSKGTRCPKPHVDYVESIDEREILSKLKFCHDFQNRGMCRRSEDCKFLHVTRREEDEFLLTGTVPQTVFKRMREWDADSNLYNSFEGDSFGGGGGGRKRPHPDSMYGGGDGYGYRRGGGGGFGSRGGGRGGMRGRGKASRGGGTGGVGSGGIHSSSQPVTYENYCIDYLKGTCVKGSVCYLRHVETIDNPDDRQGIVKQVFCHDFQNDRCKRLFCKFVHASRNEESFFLENGYFPPSMNARNREKMFFSDTCLDFLRNQCVRGASCQYKHVQKIEDHSERVCLSRSIFCHDYQEGECMRPNCKMLHTSRQDEKYFIESGTLPEHLRGGVTGGPGGGMSTTNSSMSKFVANVCRDFVKNQCTRGNQCRFYHPPAHELEKLLSHQNAGNPNLFSSSSSGGGGGGAAGTAIEQRHEELTAENEALKTRNQQLERLLADACYCMTLAVGDQNPAIAQLMKTIAEMAPESALARHPPEENGEGASTIGSTEGSGVQVSVPSSA